MNIDTFNHADRSGFLERLGRLAGCTTWREPGGGNGTSYVTRKIPMEHAMALALAMSRANPRDVGPDVAYSVGTGIPHHRTEVMEWLADKLLRGTGSVGRKAQPRLGLIAGQSYDLVIGLRRHISPPRQHAKEFELLVNIGAGWLWITMEMAVERAERAMSGRVSEPRKRQALPAS
ncbi:hypothetical protein FHW84_001812 [Dyella sp. SG562]|uniref:hypothetical protein n=1 Tax=Dyella sp. SG562 TaxID=2587017 RepID=UPI00141E4AD6|nr:hypothetical protein [Dyella sp. SG562]NII73243.1 hypothetical protein [Dyella sp. SG562]